MSHLEPNAKRQQTLERIARFRLFDDSFMSAVFQSSPVCAELLLRIILADDNLKIGELSTQYTITNLHGRSVRFDIHAFASDGREMDIEIQRADQGAMPERARYNASIMDANKLKPGDSFARLTDTYVIFITENDVFGYNQPLYIFERTLKDNNLLLNDGSHIIYVNGAYRGTSPLGWLIHDLHCVNPQDMHYQLLAEQVDYLKNTTKGVNSMCKLMEEWFHEETLEIAKKLLAEGVSLAIISKATNISITELEKLLAPKQTA